ncbi:hypothetical protein AX15_000346 [Amanita polypyramis BW_CC]|nr:hypothetical protein AX15_000346 [Amanita polypyramis BW_CC]
MASPSHYIRSIHSSLAAHSNSPRGPHGVLFDLGGVMNQYPPGLGYGPQEVPYRPVGRRRPPHTAPLESPKRLLMHLPKPVQPPIQPPPPQPLYNKFDPFADENAIELVGPIPSQSVQTVHSFQKKSFLQSSLPSTSPSPLLSRSMVHNPWPPFTSGRGNSENAMNRTSLPSALGNREARAKLVAGILLNRVHAVGKPMRRRYCGESREYVKSRLSSVITADA